MIGEIVAILIGLGLGGLGVILLWWRKGEDLPPPVEKPVYKPGNELKVVDDEIPDSSGSVSVDDLVSWADRDRKRAGNTDDDGGGV